MNITPHYVNGYTQYCIKCLWKIRETEFLGGAVTLQFCDNDDCEQVGLFTNAILTAWDKESFDEALANRKLPTHD